VGPVGVRAHLVPFLPGHPMLDGPAIASGRTGPGAGRGADIEVAGTTPAGPVAAAPYGSAGILPSSWAYLRMMGPEGLRKATQAAVLAANYVASRLGPH